MRQLLLLLLNLVYGLYEDQIGKFDWRKELIGVPLFVAFDVSKGPTKYVSVYSERNVSFWFFRIIGLLQKYISKNGYEWNFWSGVLAVVNANSNDGEIVWRRTMPKNEGKPKYLFSARNGPITVTESGIVRFWDNTAGREGSLIKEGFPNERDYKFEQCIRLYSKYQVICSYQNVEDGSAFLQIYTESSSEECFFIFFFI